MHADMPPEMPLEMPGEMQATDRVITLKERKETERARRMAAVLRDRLAAYARSHGGRFLLYGSAARGTMRYNSDVDVLVEFTQGDRAAAWAYAEQLGRDLGVLLDLNDVDCCSAAFLAHIEAIPLS